MSKICAKCSKAVYPLEELKCLDKIWHKGCFRCWECNMTLNMKNYKGYDKKPYCCAHYPQTKATVVADTPELQRLARNTELQSQVKYHEEFEKKIKGSKIQISDDPETQRIKQVNSVVSQVEYKGVREKTGSMESRRQSLPPTSEKKERWPSVSSGGQGEFPKSPYSDRNTSNSIVYSSDGKVEAPRQKRIGSIADYDPVNENYGSLAHGYNPVSRLSQSQEWEETVPVSPSMVVAKRNSIKEKSIDIEVNERELTDHNNKKEEDEDLNGDSRELDSEDVFHNERTNSGNEEVPSPKEVVHHGTEAFSELKENVEIKTEEVQNASSAEEITEDKPQEQRSHESKEIHGDTDDNVETKSTFPPSNAHENVAEHASVPESEPIIVNRVEEPVDEAEEREEEASKSETEEERNQSPEDNKAAEGKPLTGTFAALYDYEAQDDDEVGFLEGDQVVQCELIDAGWMVGTVVRTGERGMLPANYVEQVI